MDKRKAELKRGPLDVDIKAILANFLSKIEDLQVKLDTHVLEATLEGTDREKDYEEEMAAIDAIQDRIRTTKFVNQRHHPAPTLQLLSAVLRCPQRQPTSYHK